MRVNQVEVGQKYQMKVSGKVVTVHVDGETIRCNGRTGYTVTNLSTKRTIQLKSAARLKPLLQTYRYYLDVTKGTLDATSKIGTFIEDPALLPSLGNVTKELTYAEAVRLVNEHVGVGSWPLSSVKARTQGGLPIPEIGRLRIRTNQ